MPDNLPELGSDLVAALAGLHVHDFSHGDGRVVRRLKYRKEIGTSFYKQIQTLKLNYDTSLNFCIINLLDLRLLHNR